MLQAMNTGHDGSMTLFTPTNRETCWPIETLVLMAGFDCRCARFGTRSRARLDVIVHVERLRDGTTKSHADSEVTGMEET